MEDIPEYAQRDIEKGEAFLTTDKEEIKKIVRKKLMPYIKDLSEDYIQQEVDGWTEALYQMKGDYMYYTDLDMTFIKFIPDYVRLTVEGILVEAERAIQRIVEDARGGIDDK